MALGLDGGYEAVQMRDVAARADVAMGTVYRYFTSKDHLLAAALVHWVEQLDARLAQVAGPGRHRRPARVIDVAGPGAACDGPPAPAGRRRVRRPGLPRPGGHRVPAAGVGAHGGDHHPGHR